MSDIVPGFTGSPLDRADHIRIDGAALAAARADPAARLLRLDGIDPELDEQGLLRWDVLDGAGDDPAIALLGLIDGAPRFTPIRPVSGERMRSPALYMMLNRMPQAEAATFAAARSLIAWHARHRFCANCGAATAPFRAGWGRKCDACATEHFPRVDPVVIMLAQHGQGAEARVLVGRQRIFPPRSYSALAGFVEPGESIEEAVARELHEEAGVRAVAVRYLASQPWPFPSQLMIGAVAMVEDDRLTVDMNELEDAKWVTRDEVAAAMAGDPQAVFTPPPPYALANTLFARWLAES